MIAYAFAYKRDSTTTEPVAEVFRSKNFTSWRPATKYHIQVLVEVRDTAEPRVATIRTQEFIRIQHTGCHCK